MTVICVKISKKVENKIKYWKILTLSCKCNRRKSRQSINLKRRIKIREGDEV